MGLRSIVLTGKYTKKIEKLCDQNFVISIPADNTSRVQERCT